MKLESEKEVIVFYKIKQDALERLFFFCQDYYKIRCVQHIHIMRGKK